MKTIVAVFAAVLVLAGCSGSSEEPERAAAAEPAEPSQPVVVEVRIEDGKVSPQGGRVEVSAGSTVDLRVTSDAAEQIHVHSDPEHTYEVAAGQTIDESFVLTTPGQVAVEAHELDVTIVQLVVRP